MKDAFQNFGANVTDNLTRTIQEAVKNVEDQAKAAVDEALGQISVDIEEESSGPSFV